MYCGQIRKPLLAPKNETRVETTTFATIFASELESMQKNPLLLSSVRDLRISRPSTVRCQDNASDLSVGNASIVLFVEVGLPICFSAVPLFARFSKGNQREKHILGVPDSTQTQHTWLFRGVSPLRLLVLNHGFHSTVRVTACSWDTVNRTFGSSAR